VQVVEQVDAARVPHADALLAGAEREGLEDVTLTCPGLTGDYDIVAPAHEVEAGKLENHGFVDAALESPVEGFKGLSLDKAAAVDATVDAVLELVCHLDTEHVLEQRGRVGALLSGPGKMGIELGQGGRQA
jgi:hypothetical protein